MRDAQTRSEELFSDGLQKWIQGEEVLEAEAAGQNLGYILLLHRRWLESQQNQK